MALLAWKIQNLMFKHPKRSLQLSNAVSREQKAIPKTGGSKQRLPGPTAVSPKLNEHQRSVKASKSKSKAKIGTSTSCLSKHINSIAKSSALSPKAVVSHSRKESKHKIQKKKKRIDHSFCDRKLQLSWTESIIKKYEQSNEVQPHDFKHSASHKSQAVLKTRILNLLDKLVWQ